MASGLFGLPHQKSVYTNEPTALLSAKIKSAPTSNIIMIIGANHHFFRSLRKRNKSFRNSTSIVLV